MEPSAFTRFLWWLSTAHIPVLETCKKDWGKYSVVGTSVLVTWAFATLAWTFFFSTVVDDVMLYIPLGIAFGAAILSIDRLLLSGMTLKANNQWLMVGLRITLAITIGWFIAQPLMLFLFQSEIAEQMLIDQEAKKQAYAENVRTGNSTAYQLNKAQLDQLQAGITAKEKEVAKLRDAYVQEADGTGGSGRRGEARIAKLKKMEYEKGMESLTLLKESGETEIKRLQTALQGLEKSQQDQVSGFQKKASSGFLMQIEALDHIVEAHGAAKLRYRLIAFLLILIEVLPVLSKLLLPKGLYEEKMALHLDEDLKNTQMQHEKQLALDRRFNELTREQEEDLVDTFLRRSEPVRAEKTIREIESWRDHDLPFRQMWSKLQNQLFQQH